MISWAIQIEDRQPPGWDPWQDTCAFPDFDHQKYLLPYFDFGEVPIDPYGGTEFSTADTRRLRAHLTILQDGIEARSEAWSVTETNGETTHTTRLRRERILALLGRTFACATKRSLETAA